MTKEELFRSRGFKKRIESDTEWFDYRSSDKHKAREAYYLITKNLGYISVLNDICGSKSVGGYFVSAYKDKTITNRSVEI